jgi:hypothetical protein
MLRPRSATDSNHILSRVVSTTNATNARADESRSSLPALLAALFFILAIALLPMWYPNETAALGITLSPVATVVTEKVSVNNNVNAKGRNVTRNASVHDSTWWEPSGLSCIAENAILPSALKKLHCRSKPYFPQLKSCVIGCTATSSKASPVIVRPYGGLANRLRVITSYLVHARETGRRLIVQWRKSVNFESCPVDFSELFQTTSLPQDVEVDLSFSGKPNYVGTSPYGKKLVEGPRRDGPLLLATLVPRPHLVLRINDLLHQLGCGSFLAIHVRRTDLNSNYAADGEFVKWANEQPSLPVFLATDNPRSLTFFQKKLGSRLVTQAIDRSTHQDGVPSVQTGLIDMVRLKGVVVCYVRLQHYTTDPK